MSSEDFRSVGEVVSSLEGNLVCFTNFRSLAELRADPVQRIFHWPVVEPVKDTEREEVFAAVNLFARQFDVSLQRVHAWCQ